MVGVVSCMDGWMVVGRFLLDGEVKREVVLDRPLQPLKLYMSVWTTTGTGRLSLGKCSEGLCGKIGRSGWDHSPPNHLPFLLPSSST